MSLLLRKFAEPYSCFGANGTTTSMVLSGPEQLLDDISAAKAGRWGSIRSFVASSIASVGA